MTKDNIGFSSLASSITKVISVSLLSAGIAAAHPVFAAPTADNSVDPCFASQPTAVPSRTELIVESMADKAIIGLFAAAGAFVFFVCGQDAIQRRRDPQDRPGNDHISL